jgi:phosphoenolpyruvate synthase/pyruvate phosphate dikinase
LVNLTTWQIAEHADFFSFGTNDLTQMTFGYSRDDVGKFLPIYLAQGILQHDPFEVIKIAALVLLCFHHSSHVIYAFYLVTNILNGDKNVTGA